MIDFSIRSFKDYLNKPLEKQEITFLIKTFSRSCIYFFLLMIFVVASGTLLRGAIGSNVTLFLLLNAMVTLVGIFALFYYSLKYRLDPLGVSNSTISACWILMTLVFTCAFLSIISFYFGNLGGNVLEFATHLLTAGVVVFGVTIALYTIPVIVGFYIQNRKTIISLTRFLSICAIIYFSFLFVFALILIFSIQKDWKGFDNLKYIPLVLCAIMAFLSPIVTIYRMKTIVPYINYDDDFERKRWQNFFVFGIVQELLHLAYTIARFLATFLSRGAGSRLG